MARDAIVASSPPLRDGACPTPLLWLTVQSLSIKSIKSLVPLLDRVLVQRVKAVEVSASPSLHLAHPAENRLWTVPPVRVHAGPRPRRHGHRCRPRCARP